MEGTEDRGWRKRQRRGIVPLIAEGKESLVGKKQADREGRKREQL